MPRQRQKRKMLEPPKFKGYKPFGVTRAKHEYIDLLFEEYEAIKLADYQLLNHKEAGQIMGVSRATFARIYENARRKIAEAMVETKQIRAVLGDVFFDLDWYLCNDCNERFTLKNHKNKENCPTCKSDDLVPLNN